MTFVLEEIVKRLSDRSARRTEADVQADVRSFILGSPLSLEEGDVKEVSLETPVGKRQRIDVEVGCTAIEVKRDLRRGRVRTDAIEQLAGYVETRAEETGLRYVGILTDGAEWHCYHLVDKVLVEVSELEIDGASDPDILGIWLEGVLGTRQGIYPVAAEIQKRLGAQSSSHKLDRATLLSLYSHNHDLPSVKLKRALWSRLLTSALGTQFIDTNDLFVEHTLLVNSAEIIAHAVLGLDVKTIDATSLVTGLRFDESGVFGVVEADFFDWVVEVPEGQQFVSTLGRRLSRFQWSTANHDILKVLYESVIGTETRQRLGEYYTPDWMAEHVVATVIDDPLSQRILDPACGSGTFLFHAIRHLISRAEADGLSLPEILERLTNQIVGIDLHPVAVAFARVTYLLAIGKSRLTSPERQDIRIPVYLGDSIQWRQQVDLLTSGSLVVQTTDRRELFTSELRFPQELLTDAVRFDQLVAELASKASTRRKKTAAPSLNSVFSRFGVPTRAQEELTKTFQTMCRLHDEDRDHIWSYYVRNLARPLWLSEGPNRVDALVGNPPWLAFRKMTSEMQRAFRILSQDRGMWHGAELATQQDLSGVFIAKAVQLYLKIGGKFGFVMPNAAVDRPHFAGLRTGRLDSPGELLRIKYSKAWDFRRIRPHIFPRGSCVLFGSREDEPEALPPVVLFHKGRLPKGATQWEDVEAVLTVTSEAVQEASPRKPSIYKDRFLNGATIFPRVLFMVDELESSPLGLAAGRVRVRSIASSTEKAPWKNLPRLQGVVESQFVRPIYTSDTLLPFRTLSPTNAVIPIAGDKFLVGPDGDVDAFPGLSLWWKHADAAWNENRSSERLSLAARLNYMRNLTLQLPIPATRILYNKSGMHVVAAKVANSRAIVENGLYWAVPSSADEADYLCAILNSPILTELARPLMSYGKDERDIAKSVWQLPIPEFSPKDRTHLEIVKIAKALEALAHTVKIDTKMHFAAARRKIRTVLDEASESKHLNDAVRSMLG